MTGPFDSLPTGSTPAPAPQDHALPCPECCGEGFIEVIGGPGYFDDTQECWMPGEDVEPCGACRGAGVQDRDELDGSTSAELRQPTHDHVEAAEGAEPALPF